MPRPLPVPPSAGELAPERRRRLFTVAAREFAQSGYRAASLNRILRACDMRKSSFYHFFAGKQVLFDSVVLEAAAAMSADLAAPAPAAFAGARFWERLFAFVAHAVEAGARDTWYQDLGKMFYLTDAASGEQTALQRVLCDVGEWVREVLEVGRASGAIGTEMPVSLQVELVMALLQAMDHWSVHHMHEFSPPEQKRLATRQMAALQALLAPVRPPARAVPLRPLRR